jgi:hypothetical protein
MKLLFFNVSMATTQMFALMFAREMEASLSILFFVQLTVAL